MRVVKTKNRTVLHETPEKCRMEEHHFVGEKMRHLIEKKAYELYEGRGCVPGRDIDDWLEAEQMIKQGREKAL